MHSGFFENRGKKDPWELSLFSPVFMLGILKSTILTHLYLDLTFSSVVLSRPEGPKPPPVPVGLLNARLTSSCTVSPQVRWRCRALTATSTQPSLQCLPCMWFWLCLFTWPGMKARRKGRAKTTRICPHRLVRPQEMDRHRPAVL